jgi:OmpA-OmpF porin, OOP family
VYVKKLLIAGSLALASASAVADAERGFYLNASFGQAQYDISQQDLDDVALLAFESAGVTVLDADSTFDDEGSPWSIGGGYRFSRYLAVEVGYLDLGSAEYRAAGTVFVPGVGVVDSTLGLDISAKGPTLAALVTAPLGEKFDVHGRLGMFFADTTFELGIGLDTFDESDEFSANSEDFFAGVGAAYHFTPNFAASIDFSLFKDVGDDEETGEGDIDSLTLGLQYTF